MMFVKVLFVALLSASIVSATAVDEATLLAYPNITQAQFRCAMTPTGANSTVISEADFLTQWYAFVNTSIRANLSLADAYEASTFLGSVAFNTDYLQSMQARCARGGPHDFTCDHIYKEACPGHCTLYPDQHTWYYPRGTQMMTFACNYYQMKTRFELYGKGENVFLNPDLVNYPYKGHLSGAFVWQQGGNSSCAYLTKQGDFGACLRKLNPWECDTEAGQTDNALRNEHILRVSSCFDLVIDNSTLACPAPANTTTAALPKCPPPNFSKKGSGVTTDPLGGEAPAGTNGGNTGNTQAPATSSAMASVVSVASLVASSFIVLFQL